jgi:hypothetical protein
MKTKYETTVSINSSLPETPNGFLPITGELANSVKLSLFVAAVLYPDFYWGITHSSAS